MATYQSIYILSLIIILTTIIGEFKRFETEKEGFGGLGKLFSGIGKIFKTVGDIFKKVFDTFKKIE